MNIKKKIFNFFWSVAHSCYDMEYYRKIRQKTWKSAILYLLIVVVLVNAVWTVVIALPMYWNAKDMIISITQDLQPADAYLKVVDGKIQTNIDAGTTIEKDGLTIVVDASFEGNEHPVALANGNGMFFGRDYLFLMNSFGDKQAIAWSNYDDLDFERVRLLDWFNNYAGYITAGFLLAIYLLRLLLVIISKFIFALFGAGVAYYAGRTIKQKLNYKQWLAVSFHALTLPLIFELLFSSLGIAIPFAFTVVYFMILFSVLLDEKARPINQSVETDSVDTEDETDKLT